MRFNKVLYRKSSRLSLINSKWKSPSRQIIFVSRDSNKKADSSFFIFFSVAVWMALYYALSVVVPRSADAYSPYIHGNLFWSVSGESRQTTRKDLH